MYEKFNTPYLSSVLRVLFLLGVYVINHDDMLRVVLLEKRRSGS
jgi:hypothetical protein